MVSFQFKKEEKNRLALTKCDASHFGKCHRLLPVDSVPLVLGLDRFVGKTALGSSNFFKNKK